MLSISIFLFLIQIAGFLTISREYTRTKYSQKKFNEEYFEHIDPSIREDAKLLAPDLIEKYGYPCETHSVTTKDGYILEIHRIPHGNTGPSENRPAVLVMHGILASSAEWVIPGPGRALPYILADSGYDVWLGNVRGNRYSRKHIELDPTYDAEEFWDYSFHEIGMEDVPASVDYVRNVTNQTKIFYIGHSQGTTISYVMLSRLEEYNSKLKAVISLAPTSYMKRMFNPLVRLLAKFAKLLGAIADLIGIHEILPHNDLLSEIGLLLCNDNSTLQDFCVNFLFTFSGPNDKQLNRTLMPVLMGHFPAGCSANQLLHYAQEINSGKFREWDYGGLGNFLHYGRTTPPDYNASAISVPLYIYYSNNDWFVNVEDVKQFAGEVGNLQGIYLIEDEEFGHIDFVVGISAPDLIHKPIVELMKKIY